MDRATPVIGGLVPFSSVDWPGHLAAVIFMAGCPWRCHYCHNPHLQRRAGAHDWAQVLCWLRARRGLLDGVVFSGGEPLMDPCCLNMIRQVKAQGFKTALHTAGIYPEKLRAALPDLDWVALDIKTNEPSYDSLTGRPRTAAPVRQCLDLLLQAGRPFECRTTWSEDWLAEAGLLALAAELAGLGVSHYALQRYRPPGQQRVAARLSAQGLQVLQAMFPVFEYR